MSHVDPSARRRYKTMIERDDGWCDWIQPVQNYRMMCCDCGLVHDMQFGVLKKLKEIGPGEWDAKQLEWGPYRIEFRARRNDRATAAARRKRA